MTVLLFGVTRDIVGEGSTSILSADGIETVGDLKRVLMERYPALRELSSLALAVNQSYARDEDPVNEADEIALIPPVSGG
ncbi:MAG: molybdopterin converting factor subunit 1 [Flavobacteriaceae bacterium]|jgi:molybdopterin synthase sulfur carrier subunit|nr:MAG: molybdopterin converting factor subunit 1 [Flavobacteriaceae bacterium]